MKKTSGKLCVGLILLVVPLLAYPQQSLPDTIYMLKGGSGDIPKEYYKLNRKEFLARYGTSDINREFIMSYFRKRRWGMNKLAIGLGMGGLGGASIGVSIEAGFGGHTRSANFFAASGIVLALGGATGIIGGPIQRANYPRYKLYKLLVNHHNGEPLPVLYRKRRFRMPR